MWVFKVVRRDCYPCNGMYWYHVLVWILLMLLWFRYSVKRLQGSYRNISNKKKKIFAPRLIPKK